MAELGIRELRADLAALVRRAAAGESLLVTVNGRPAARLGPLTESGEPGGSLAPLISSGAIIAPRRTDHVVPDRTVAVWGSVRLDRLLREIRG